MTATPSTIVPTSYERGGGYCRATVRSLSILIGQGESLVWSSWGVSTPPEDDDDDVYPPPLNITLLVGEDAGREWFDASDVRSEERRRSPATPKPWSSSECMAQWGMAELQRKPDPRGYLVFTEGRYVTRHTAITGFQFLY